jgi:hypothetical protein
MIVSFIGNSDAFAAESGASKKLPGYIRGVE